MATRMANRMATCVAGLSLTVTAACGGGGGDTGSALGIDDTLDTLDAPTDRRVEWVGAANVTIGGTLSLPAGEVIAGVLIIPGFGAIDRDNVMVPDTTDASADRLSQDLNYSRPGVADPLFADLAETLAGAGLASLRYDKRGSGRSQLARDQPLSFDHLVADARAGLELLSQHRATAGKPLVVLGHDQGGLVAMRLSAAPGLAAPVAAAVLVSSFGRPLDAVVGDDLLARHSPAAGQAQSGQLRQVAAALRAGGPLPLPEDLHPNLRALLLPFQESYLRQIFTIDPASEAAAVAHPTLVVRGGADTTTTVTDVDLLLGRLPAGSEALVVEGADHNLRTPAGRDRSTLDEIARWVIGHPGG